MPPCGRCHASCVVYNSQIWIIGGTSPALQGRDGLDTIIVYDPAKDEYRMVPVRLPYAVYDAGAIIVLDHYLLIAGNTINATLHTAIHTCIHTSMRYIDMDGQLII